MNFVCEEKLLSIEQKWLGVVRFIISLD